MKIQFKILVKLLKN